MGIDTGNEILKLYKANTFFIFSVVMLLSGCIKVYHKTDVKVMDAKTVQPVEMAAPDTKIGSDIKIYEVPVNISRLPKNPRLVMDFTVADKGHCLVTYEPTQIFVNTKKIASIDFRDFEFEERRVIDIDIPSSNLQVGENLIRVQTGACDYDIDVMRFNSFKLFQR